MYSYGNPFFSSNQISPRAVLGRDDRRPFQSQPCPLVISSEARSAKSRNLTSRPAHLSFRAKPEGRSREICLLSRSIAALPLCHFERSTKCEVEKSAQKVRFQRSTCPVKKSSRRKTKVFFPLSFSDLSHHRTCRSAYGGSLHSVQLNVVVH